MFLILFNMAILSSLRNTFVCLQRLLPQPHKVRTLLHPLQPLQRRQLPKGAQAFVEGMEINGRLAVVYSKDGLNDVGNAKGCCCCGGNMITESVLVNVNAFAYALLY